jgi:hypothetical protein
METTTEPSPGAFGPNSGLIEAVLERARRLSRDEVNRLDILERADRASLRAAWDELDERLSEEPERTWVATAGGDAWAAVADACRTLELDVPADDAYWQVASGTARGAARAVRFAACALVASGRLRPELVEVLLAPWRSVSGDSTAVGPTAAAGATPASTGATAKKSRFWRR